MKRDKEKKCHKNAPEKLISLFIECNRNYHTLADKINVNVRYVYQLLHDGKEPPKKTIKGRLARRKLFLDKSKKAKPDFIIKWNHLPTDERHKVIQQYILYRTKQKTP